MRACIIVEDDFVIVICLLQMCHSNIDFESHSKVTELEHWLFRTPMEPLILILF